MRAATAAASLAAASALDFQFQGNFTVSNAAFFSQATLTVGGESQPTIIVSEFTGNPFASDGLALITNLTTVLAEPALGDAVTVSTNITWPNDVSTIPSGAITGFNSSNALLVPGGFLVPPKTVGAIHVVDVDPGSGAASLSAKLSVDKGSAWLDGWFYHRAVMVDVDGDGLKDVLTARATKPLLGAEGGELVWLKQPSIAGTGASSSLDPKLLPWQETVLVNGTFSPDVFFQLIEDSLHAGDGNQQLVYTSFFTGGGLGLLVCPGCGAGGNGNTWSNAASLQMTAIDSTIGPAFDVEVVDLNGDGVRDLLVTNHVDNSTLSGVFAYEAPPPGTPLSDATAWKKHVLASGFVVRELGPAQAAPGAARTLQVPAGCGSGAAPSKPLITVAGDGDQRFYQLAAVSQDPSSWDYELTEVWDCKGTVGRQATVTLPGTACPAVFLPCFDSSSVQVFKTGA